MGANHLARPDAVPGSQVNAPPRGAVARQHRLARGDAKRPHAVAGRIPPPSPQVVKPPIVVLRSESPSRISVCDLHHLDCGASFDRRLARLHAEGCCENHRRSVVASGDGGLAGMPLSGPPGSPETDPSNGDVGSALFVVAADVAPATPGGPSTTIASKRRGSSGGDPLVNGLDRLLRWERAGTVFWALFSKDLHGIRAASPLLRKGRRPSGPSISPFIHPT